MTRRGLLTVGRNDDRTIYTGKCDVRLTTEENNLLNKIAGRNGVSRSDVVRRALYDFFKFNSCDDDDCDEED
jgi:hypothetical protein